MLPLNKTITGKNFNVSTFFFFFIQPKESAASLVGPVWRSHPSSGKGYFIYCDIRVI